MKRGTCPQIPELPRPQRRRDPSPTDQNSKPFQKTTTGDGKTVTVATTNNICTEKKGNKATLAESGYFNQLSSNEIRYNIDKANRIDG
jgi:hypothetical protein